MIHLETDPLRTFLAVCETGSFTHAADRVAKTQSAVSMQIKKLEDTLGKRLFLREKRTISITSDGQRLMPFARDIVEKAAQAAAAFDESALRGSVRLGTADDYAERFLPTILAGFSRQNPLVEVTVECVNTAALEPLVRRGELDMALVTHNEVRGHSELIRTEPLHWVTSSRHIVHTSRPVPLALGSPHCVWRKDAIAALTKQGVEHRLLYSSYSATVVGAAVLAGLAVAVLPDSALRPGMRILNSGDRFPPLPDCEIGLLRGTRDNTEVTEALANHIRRSLNALDSGDGPAIPAMMDPFADPDALPLQLRHRAAV